MQMRPVFRPEHRAATRGQHPFRQLGEFVDDIRLNVTKTCFAFALKILTDRAAQLLLENRIRVQKRHPQTPRELTTNRGFTGAREADEANRQGSETKNVVASLDGTVTVMATEFPEPQSFNVTTPGVARSALGLVPG